MASVNRVIVLGNTGRDPEVRYMPNGTAVVNVSIATTRYWKDKAGDKMEETEWHRITAYDRIAEIIGEYVKKGDPLFVEGRLKTRKWEGKDGKDNYTTEIIAENIQLLGSSGGDGGGRRGRRPEPPTEGERGRVRPESEPAAPKSKGQTGFDDMDDDIPF